MYNVNNDLSWGTSINDVSFFRSFLPKSNIAKFMKSSLATVAINDLLCMKNAGAQIAMDFS